VRCRAAAEPERQALQPIPAMIERIFISPCRGSAQVAVEQAEVKAAMGIVGDRNFGKAVHPGQNLTLVEAEEIEAFCALHRRQIDLSMTRRNLVTRGIRLNALVGRKFKAGEVLLLGVELCEPCAMLGRSLSSDELASPKVVEYWLGRGGLRADVIVGGVLDAGVRIEDAA
jgi:MOSC domain-containing protein YiiM